VGCRKLVGAWAGRWHTACKQKETDWHRFDWSFHLSGIEPSANELAELP